MPEFRSPSKIIWQKLAWDNHIHETYFIYLFHEQWAYGPDLRKYDLSTGVETRLDTVSTILPQIFIFILVPCCIHPLHAYNNEVTLNLQSEENETRDQNPTQNRGSLLKKITIWPLMLSLRIKIKRNTWVHQLY